MPSSVLISHPPFALALHFPEAYIKRAWVSCICVSVILEGKQKPSSKVPFRI